MNLQSEHGPGTLASILLSGAGILKALAVLKEKWSGSGDKRLEHDTRAQELAIEADAQEAEQDEREAERVWERYEKLEKRFEELLEAYRVEGKKNGDLRAEIARLQAKLEAKERDQSSNS